MPNKPSYQTTGIIIGRTNFGEADRVVRFITPEHGKVAAVAKGIRKIKSRSGGHLELFGEAALMLISGRNLETVASARLIWYPHQLVGDYQRLGLAFARGGIVCHSDAAALDTPMTTAQIKFWRLLCDYNYVTIAQIANAADLAADTLQLCDLFYEHHLGNAFKPTLTGETT
jgi:recombinational DNA repair protein (RecF pathway)